MEVAAWELMKLPLITRGISFSHGYGIVCSGVGTVAAVAALAATLFSRVLIFIALTLQFYS